MKKLIMMFVAIVIAITSIAQHSEQFIVVYTTPAGEDFIQNTEDCFFKINLDKYDEVNHVFVDDFYSPLQNEVMFSIEHKSAMLANEDLKEFKYSGLLKSDDESYYVEIIRSKFYYIVIFGNYKFIYLLT